MKQLLSRLILVLTLVVPVMGIAQYLVLSADPNTHDCLLPDSEPGDEVVIHVRLEGNRYGAYGTQFAAPLPAGSGLVFLYDTVPASFFKIGDSQTSVAVAFNDCVAGNTRVLAMHFMRVSAGVPCLPLYIRRDSYGYLMIADCSTNVLDVVADGILLNPDANDCPRQVNPANPVPPNGEVDVPISAELKWDEAYYPCGAPLGAGDSDYLWFGTTPDPPAVGNVGNPHAVGPLLPETTYYWRVRSGLYNFTGPVWSFKTTGATPVESSTWGRIKSLYR